MQAGAAETRAREIGRTAIVSVRTGQLLIVLGAVLVGIAIMNDTAPGRGLNAAGAVAWVAAAGVLGWSLRMEPRAGRLMVYATAAALVLAVLVRPSDLTGAVIGFGAAGAAVALLASRQPVGWAMLIPAIYLPAHLAVAITRSIAGGMATLRTEPPPTAAVVPLAMVLAAALAGWVVGRVRNRGA